MKNLANTKISGKQIALMKVAQKQLGMPDDTLIDILAAFGAQSKKDLTNRQFDELMAYFKKLGFKKKYQPKVKKAPDISRQSESKQVMLGAIETTLAALGKSWRYADGVARKMFGVEQVVWCSPEQIHKILQALKISQKREQSKSAEANDAGSARRHINES